MIFLFAFLCIEDRKINTASQHNFFIFEQVLLKRDPDKVGYHNLGIVFHTSHPKRMLTVIEMFHQNTCSSNGWSYISGYKSRHFTF